MNGEKKVSENAVSVSVVTYNSGQYIGGLLASLLEHTKGVDYHVFIADNGSTDNTIEIIKQIDSKKITLIENKKNLGFGSGHNQALKSVKSRYHLFINPDVTIQDDVVSKLAEYLDSHEDIGVVTPKILHPDGRIQVLPKKAPKLIYLLARRLHISLLKKYKYEYEMLQNDADSAFDIEFCTGAFMFARTALLKKVGGFDERYFMYFEDADLTRELRRYARAVYNSDFVVYHEWERAGSKQLKFFLIQVGSMFKYMNKWRKKNK